MLPALLLVLPLAAGSAGDARVAAPERSAQGGEVRTFVLFGASWCAPCIAELKDLSAIAAHAGPDRVIVAWSDGGIRRFTSAVPPNVEIVTTGRGRRYQRLFAVDAVGLPYAVLLTEQGQKCAAVNGRLTAEAMTAMRHTCERFVGVFKGADN